MLHQHAAGFSAAWALAIHGKTATEKTATEEMATGKLGNRKIRQRKLTW